MKKNTSRAAIVIGATMALVMAGTAAVSAAPGHRDDRMPGSGIGVGDKLPGLRGGWSDDLERREVTLQTADGVSVDRIEQGTVDSTADDALTFSLGSGESVTVVIDDDTTFIGYEEQEMVRRGWSRSVMAATEIEAEAIEAGAEVLVWSDSEDGADFVASRVIVQPADEAADEATDEAADEAADEADAAVDEATDEDADEAVADESATEGADVTDA